MALIKVGTPPTLESAFRGAASGKVGLRKGAIRDAALAALSVYSGIEPEVSLSASSSSVGVEAPSSIMPRVLAKILPRKPIRVSPHKEERCILRKLRDVKLLDQEEGYSEFQCNHPDPLKLCGLRSFRAEWDGRDMVYEEECLNVTVDGLEEALEIARSLAPVLGLEFPEEKVSGRLDIYKWRGASAQENIVR